MKKKNRLQAFRQGDGEVILSVNAAPTQGFPQPWEQTLDPTSQIPIDVAPGSGGTTQTPTTDPVTAPVEQQPTTYVPPVTTSPDPGIFTPTDPITTTPTQEPETYSDPSIEVDYYNISCQDLYSLINNVKAIQANGNLSTAASFYYKGKVSQMQSIYDNRGCRVTKDIIDPIETNPTVPVSSDTPVSTSPSVDPGIVPQSTPTTDPGPTTDPIIGTPIANNTAPTKTPIISPVPPSSGGGGGGGGGGGSATPAAPAKSKKPDFKKDWLLWLIAAAALGISIYQGRNTEIKFPK